MEIVKDDELKGLEQAPDLTFSEDELLFLQNAVEEYKGRGLKQEEAEAAARLDLKNWKSNQEIGEKVWNRLTKEISMDQLLKDQLVRALEQFKLEWEKRNKPETINFNFRLSTEGAYRDRKGTVVRIAAAVLNFEVARNGAWKVISQKKIAFQHVRDMREGHRWKLELYEAMFRDIVIAGMSYRLLRDDYEAGKLGPVPTEETK